MSIFVNSALVRYQTEQQLIANGFDLLRGEEAQANGGDDGQFNVSLDGPLPCQDDRAVRHVDRKATSTNNDFRFVDDQGRDTRRNGML